jgi:hypothetical protein
MKLIVLALLLIFVALLVTFRLGLILTNVLEWKDWPGFNFISVEETETGRVLKLQLAESPKEMTGEVRTNSGLTPIRIDVHTESETLRVMLVGQLAVPLLQQPLEYGRIYEIPVPPEVRRIEFGEEHTLIWENGRSYPGR